MRPTRRDVMLSALGLAAACAARTDSPKRKLPTAILSGTTTPIVSTPVTTETSTPSTTPTGTGPLDTGRPADTGALDTGRATDTGVLDTGALDTGTLDTGTLDTGSPPTTSGTEPADPWEPPETLDETAFAWGVQTGDAHAESVLVCCKTTEALVTLRVVRGTASDWVDPVEFVDLPVTDGIVQLELRDLEPDTTYALVWVTSDGRRSRSARTRTALAAGASRTLRFGATSCLGGNEPWPMLSRASEDRLDFFALLGDTIYADDGWNGLNWEADWRSAMSQAGMVNLCCSTSLVATWDDHEVDNNWSWSDLGDAPYEALEAFRRAIPMREGPGGLGLWRKLSWGQAADVFVLDCRGERLDGSYVSPEQLDWLIEGLQTSTAAFKIVLNSVPITNMSDVYGPIEADDRWDGYPAQRSAVLGAIVAAEVTGVLWLAGDFHWGAIATIGQPGSPYDHLWEVFCGPGGSFINPLAWLIRPDDHYVAVIREWNYTRFTLHPDTLEVDVEFVNNAGRVFESRTLDLS